MRMSLSKRTERPILGISLYDPWASLMAVGVKKFETRSWSTAYRGLLAIHSTKAFTKPDQQLVNTYPFNKYLSNPKDFPRGAVIAVGKLVAVSKTENVEKYLETKGTAQAKDELSFGNYSKGRYAWELKDIVKLEKPVFCSGDQGLWELLEDIESLVLERYSEAKSLVVVV